jgi:HSP20 family protein
MATVEHQKHGGGTMLMRTDPFRQLDRFAEQVLGSQGTVSRPSVMPMDAWRDGDTFLIEFDLPGVDPDSIDLDVERNVITVHAERPGPGRDVELLASERPRGVFSRQLVLGDNLDVENVAAHYEAGVLTLRVPVAAQAKPRKILISRTNDGQRTIDA